MIEELETLNPLGKSDHGVSSFTYLCYGEEKIIKGIPKYYKGDYEGMRENSQQNREYEVDRDINVTWKRFHSAIMTGTNKFIPCFKPGSKKKTKLDRYLSTRKKSTDNTATLHVSQCFGVILV